MAAPDAPSLTGAQRAALAHVRATARQHRDAAAARIAAVAAGAAYDVDALVAGIRAHGRVTFNFHPDRLLADGRTVAAALLDDGRYRSQFETRISNGGLTAYAGGQRDLWERRMFGGAYQAPGVTPGERPKYGGLNLMRHPDGASPRFGSCHLRLRAEVLDRCTFCFGDSYVDPDDVGTVDAFDSVLASLLESAHVAGSALGLPGVDPAALVEALLHPPPPSGLPGRSLDDYVETQVHGAVDLATDVEAVVLDPAFRDTATGEILAGVARRYDVAVEWHAGFVLAVGEVPAGFRGPAIPVLAERIHRQYATAGDRIDAALIGRAAASVVTEPDRWRDWGSPAEALQHLKQLWHVLVAFGSPAPVRSR